MYKHVSRNVERLVIKYINRIFSAKINISTTVIDRKAEFLTKNSQKYRISVFILLFQAYFSYKVNNLRYYTRYTYLV